MNDRNVYTPPTLLKSFALADGALESCITQTIKDKGLTKESQLTQLVCTHAGVASLAGIEQLQFLQELVLKNNQLLNVRALTKLPNLTLVHLQENPSLPCEQIDALAKTKPGLNIIKPDQCK